MRCHPLTILLWMFCFLCAMPVAFAEEVSEDADAQSLTVQDDVESIDAEHFLYQRWMFGANFAFSILTDCMDSSFFAETLAGSVTIGYGITPNLTFMLRLEQNVWHSEEYSDNWYSGVFDIGLGLDYQVFSPYVHMAAFLGPCILTYDTAFDDAGTTGFFFEFIPIELHWDFADHWKLIVSILSVHVDAPVVHEPELKYIQYRTTVGFAYVL